MQSWDGVVLGIGLFKKPPSCFCEQLRLSVSALEMTSILANFVYL